LGKNGIPRRSRTWSSTSRPSAGVIPAPAASNRSPPRLNLRLAPRHTRSVCQMTFSMYAVEEGRSRQ